jgi:hypothetical protein
MASYYKAAGYPCRYEHRHQHNKKYIFNAIWMNLDDDAYGRFSKDTILAQSNKSNKQIDIGLI